MKASLTKKPHINKDLKSNGNINSKNKSQNNSISNSKVDNSNKKKIDEKEVINLFTKLKSKEYSKAKIPIMNKGDSNIPTTIHVKKSLRNTLHDVSMKSNNITRQNSIKSLKSNENISVQSNGNNENKEVNKGNFKVETINSNIPKNNILKRNTFQIIESNYSENKLKNSVKFGFNRTFVPHPKNKESYDISKDEMLKMDEEKRKLKEIFNTKVKINKDEYLRIFNENNNASKNGIRKKQNNSDNNFSSNNNSYSNFINNNSNNSSMNGEHYNENGCNSISKDFNKHKKLLYLKKKIDTNKDVSKNELNSGDVIEDFNSFFTKENNYDSNITNKDDKNKNKINNNENLIPPNVPKYAFNFDNYYTDDIDPNLIKALDEVNEDYSKLKKMLNKVKSERKIQVQKSMTKINKETSDNLKTHLNIVKTKLENQKNLLSTKKSEEFKKLRFNNSVDYILEKEKLYRSNLSKHDEIFSSKFNGFKKILTKKIISQNKKKSDLNELYNTNSEMVQNERLLSKTYVDCLSKKIKDEKRVLKVKKINDLVEKKKKLASSCLDEIEQVLEEKDKLIKKSLSKTPYVMSLESERKFKDRIKFKFN